MSDYLVSVCAACRTASCWQYVFLCEDARGAATLRVPASSMTPDIMTRAELAAFLRVSVSRLAHGWGPP